MELSNSVLEIKMRTVLSRILYFVVVGIGDRPRRSDDRTGQSNAVI